MDTRTISVGAYSGVERDSKLLLSFMGSFTETVSLSTFSKERDLLPSVPVAKAGTARLKIIAKTRIQEASRFQDVGWDIFFTLLISSGTGRGPYPSPGKLPENGKILDVRNCSTATDTCQSNVSTKI